MELFSNFISNFDAGQMVLLLISVAASVLCVTVHELCHGFAAWLLGDDTARAAGRLTLNPLAHIDPVGLLMLVVAKVGWAKPVPVNVYRFRQPKRDMALTALAGPVSNMLLAVLAMGISTLIYRLLDGPVWAYVMFFLCYVSVLSVGLALFNLIPIPPLDGSKLLASMLPDAVYSRYMRMERYLMIVVIALAWFGFFSGPLGYGISTAIRLLCGLFDFPFSYFIYSFGL